MCPGGTGHSPAWGNDWGLEVFLWGFRRLVPLWECLSLFPSSKAQWHSGEGGGLVPLKVVMASLFSLPLCDLYFTNMPSFSVCCNFKNPSSGISCWAPT